MLSAVKGGLFATARRLGVMAGVARSGWRRQRLLILCYHGVSLDDEHEWNGGLYVSPTVLRQRFEVLRRGGYSVLSLDEGIRRMYQGTLPSKAVALTFDDGTYDFYVRALPLLREFGFAATVYVPTYYTRFQRPVFNTMLAYVAWKARDHSAIPAHGLADGPEPLAVSTATERARSVERVRNEAERLALTAEAKDARVRLFADRLGVDYDALLARRVLHLMTPDELRQAAAAGVDVQLHTHRHWMPEDRALFRREIDDNRRELHAVLGDQVVLRHFCYPSGEHRPAFLPWLEEAEVESATTCDPGLATSTTHPLQLPRFIDTMGQSRDAFEAWASGFAELLPRRTRRGRHAGD